MNICDTGIAVLLILSWVDCDDCNIQMQAFPSAGIRRPKVPSEKKWVLTKPNKCEIHAVL